MTRHLGHDVHEGQRMVGLIHLECGGLAAQDFRKDIVAIVTHQVFPSCVHRTVVMSIGQMFSDCYVGLLVLAVVTVRSSWYG